MNNGFTLIVIIIAIAIVAILVVGFSLRGSNQQSTIETGTEAIERAEEVRNLLEERTLMQ